MNANQESILFKQLAQIQKELRELKNLVNPLVPPKDEILNMREAMQLTGFSKRKIYGLTHDGAIPYTKVENRLRFSRNSLIQWMQQQ